MAKRELTITRTFDATREKVWRAWTDPEQLKGWWAPRGFTSPTVKIDPRVGGQLYIVMLA
ncbi:MAG TPA: SRPBCC domain-containing protein, partial [Candidatus Paceibacterota bacterium]|nr:SRPBCC domain-containing protein [Candidatus Paceibacterota bacterium]